MTIEALIKAVPPPDVPFESFSGPWASIEAKLGVMLPPDYKDFVRLYGNGRFLGFLNIAVPRSRKPFSDLETRVRTFCDAVDRSEARHPFWPAPDGLIPFAWTDDGDDLFWLSRGPPAEWPVVVWDRGLSEPEVFECGLTDFLAGLASGEVLPKEFPRDLLHCDRLFAPNGDASQVSAARTTPITLSWRLGAYGLSGVSARGVRDDD